MRRQPIYSGPYRINPQPSLDFAAELTVDLFAGGGGASTGMEMDQDGFKQGLLLEELS